VRLVIPRFAEAMQMRASVTRSIHSSPALTACSSRSGTEGAWSVVIHSAVSARRGARRRIGEHSQQRLAADTRDQPQWP
jgi:hypothetical protein